MNAICKCRRSRASDKVLEGLEDLRESLNSVLQDLLRFGWLDVGWLRLALLAARETKRLPKPCQSRAQPGCFGSWGHSS